MAEIEFTELDRGRCHARSRPYKGLREDKSPRDVSLEATARRRGPGAGAERHSRPPRRCSTRSSGCPRRSLAVLTDGQRAEALQLGQGPVPQPGVHEGRPHRLLRTDRPGGPAAPARPPADAQALPERRRRAVLLREAVALAPARMGADGEDRRRQLHARARTARRSSGWRTSPISSCTRRCRWRRPRSARRCSCSISIQAPGGHHRMLRGGARAPRTVRAARTRERGQELRIEGAAGLRPSEHPRRLRQTKPFARRIAELLEQRMPELVVSRMTKRLRPGKVLVDWSQNDAHKTTVNVYSVRARERATVSTPLSWEEVTRCRAERRPRVADVRHRAGARSVRAAERPVRATAERQAVAARARLRRARRALSAI